MFDLLVMDHSKRDSVAFRRLQELERGAGLRQQGLWRVISGDTSVAELNRFTW